MGVGPSRSSFVRAYSSRRLVVGRRSAGCRRSAESDACRRPRVVGVGNLQVALGEFVVVSGLAFRWKIGASSNAICATMQWCVPVRSACTGEPFMTFELS